MVRSPCVSLKSLEPDVHRDAAVLFGVSRAYDMSLTKPSSSLIYRRLMELLVAQPSPSLRRPFGYCLRLPQQSRLTCACGWTVAVYGSGCGVAAGEFARVVCSASKPRARRSERSSDIGRATVCNIIAEERRDERAQLAVDMYPAYGLYG